MLLKPCPKISWAPLEILVASETYDGISQVSPPPDQHSGSDIHVSLGTPTSLPGGQNGTAAGTSWGGLGEGGSACSPFLGPHAMTLKLKQY